MFDSYNPATPFPVLADEVPEDVEPPVGLGVFVELDPPANDTFCNTPRSMTDPPLRTIPCKAVGVLFVAVEKLSVSITVIVQSEFRTYVPTGMASPPCAVMLARIFPAPSK